jgi:hypothetical protein
MDLQYLMQQNEYQLISHILYREIQVHNRYSITFLSVELYRTRFIVGIDGW